MGEIAREVLYGKLGTVAFKAAESATVLCKMRGNPYVELVHWVQTILETEGSDWQHVARHFSLDPARLSGDIVAAIDALPRGATSIRDLSTHFETAVREGWVQASLVFGAHAIRTGHVLVAVLGRPELRRVLMGVSREFGKIELSTLEREFVSICGDSTEATVGTAPAAAAPGEASAAMPGGKGSGEALETYTVDLTAQARSGELDSIVGRDIEIRQIIDILMRRKQNNPILTGEAGVGKTAVVEGFALRIAAGDVPPSLQNVHVRTLDLGLLQAGASMKGEFEQRLRDVIDQVQASPVPIILFIDEAHTLIGAGGAAGQGDAANLLKPALARGQLRTIAATTWDEYQKFIEPDPALVRRFQVVKVDEPNEERAVLMMRGVAPSMERHHEVQVLDEALEAAVSLSHRYIPDRQLPDKAISLLDTAAARVAVSQHATPAAVEDCRRRIEALERELEIIDREENLGIDVTERRASARAARDTALAELEPLETRWSEERELVREILDIRARIRASAAPVEGTGSELERGAEEAVEAEAADDPAVAPLGDDERRALIAELQSRQADLTELQGERPLMLPSVDAVAVGTVIADWTGIPVGRMVKDEVTTVLELESVLGQRVLGQDHALDAIAQRIRTARAGLDNPSKPVGVFMLCGPSGVGKTETAIALAESLYGGEQNLITINMSEYQEAHTVSLLKGAPPGYVGYGEGGVLTEAVRRRPYSVVLLDEVEKAHSDVHEMFFQVFDKGVMEDSRGRIVDFKNTVIILTSNVGTELCMSLFEDPDLAPAPEDAAKALRPPLLEAFPAALLGRLVVIPYKPLDAEMLGRISRLQLDRVAARTRERHGVPFLYDDAVVDLVVSRCTEVESGGRAIDAILTGSILPTVSLAYLTRLADGRPFECVRVTVEDGDLAYAYELDGPASVPAIEPKPAGAAAG